MPSPGRSGSKAALRPNVRFGSLAEVRLAVRATLEAKRVKLLAQLQAAPPPMPRLHPNLAELYRQKVMKLVEALNDDGTRLEAGECIRELIEEIRLVPDNGKLRAGRCQSKILNTWSGHRTAQIDPEKCRKINGREIRF
jgi:hypothetical protein